MMLLNCCGYYDPTRTEGGVINRFRLRCVPHVGMAIPRAAKGEGALTGSCHLIIMGILEGIRQFAEI